MPPTDLEICDILQAQYNKVSGTFDSFGTTGIVDWGVKSYPDCTLIAFEGTHDVPGWIADFEAVMSYTDYGRVEEGFFTGLQQTLKEIIALIPKDKPIYVVGHSLGAARAHIFTRLLIACGYDQRSIMRVVFGSPRPGDAEFASGLAESPCSAYLNYVSYWKQDKVCQVPFYFPLLWPYVHPGPYIYVKADALPDDKWLAFKWHHLFLYRQGLINLGVK